jgi:hypothetical protein
LQKQEPLRSHDGSRCKAGTRKINPDKAADKNGVGTLVRHKLAISNYHVDDGSVVADNTADLFVAGLHAYQVDPRFLFIPVSFFYPLLVWPTEARHHEIFFHATAFME